MRTVWLLVDRVVLRMVLETAGRVNATNRKLLTSEMNLTVTTFRRMTLLVLVETVRTFNRWLAPVLVIIPTEFRVLSRVRV